MDYLEKFKKMTAQEKSEYLTCMQPTYIFLENDEKIGSIYKERLNLEISNVCKEHCKISNLEAFIFYGEDYNLIEERYCKEKIITKLETIKKRFIYYKKTESESIEADATLKFESKNDMKQQLNDLIKNVNYKIDTIIKQYKEDIEKIEDTLKREKFKAIVGAEVKIRKEQVRQMRRDIEEYCINTLCNTKDLLKVKNLRLLNKNYEQIISRTLKSLVATNNSDELTKLFIKEFNQNVKMEKAII